MKKYMNESYFKNEASRNNTQEEAKQIIKQTSKLCGLSPIYVALFTEVLKLVLISPFKGNSK